jgi:hypothetical protein
MPATIFSMERVRFRSRVKIPGSQFRHRRRYLFHTRRHSRLHSDFTGFLYCAFGSWTVASVNCLTQYPDGGHNDVGNHIDCENESGDGFDVDKVDPNGNVLGYRNCVLFNLDGTGQDGQPSGCSL